jgi:hypothetical protein
VVGGIARARDAMVRDAINTAVVDRRAPACAAPRPTPPPAPATENITTIGDYNTVADLDTIAQALAVLGGNYELEGERRHLRLAVQAEVNMSLDPYMAKSDIKLDWLNDINFTTYEKLPTTPRAVQRGLHRRGLLPLRQVRRDLEPTTTR